MAKKNGTGGVVKTGANIIAELNAWSTNDSVNKITGRSFGETVEQAAAGARTVTGTLKGFMDTTDTNGQLTLIPGAIVALSLYPDGEASGDTFDLIAEALIDTVTKNTQTDQYVTFDATFHANTLPVPSTVP